MIRAQFRKGSAPTIFAFALVCMSIASAAAQTRQNSPTSSSPGTAAPPLQTEAAVKVVHVKYADVHQILHLLDFFNVPMRADSTLKVITLEGPPARVAAVEEAIKQLDVPPPPPQDIVITGYLLMAAHEAVTGTAIEPGQSWALPEIAGSAVPRQLSGVIDQLKQVLNYKDFAVVDALTLRTLNGGHASVSGLTPIGRPYAYHHNAGTPSPGSNLQARLDFGVLRASVIREKGTSSVSLLGLRLSVRPLPPYPTAPAAITTDIDVGQNQQVVVGKTDVLSPNLALFLVISAKITD
ncbi:MAG TPA: secretin N-terminal domain-containing protein [Terriglobia bacterium]|nr:secretin N-terminal domain-containing protein [Terriglobia bacterium]